jgi:hypothetical protein
MEAGSLHTPAVFFPYAYGPVILPRNFGVFQDPSISFNPVPGLSAHLLINSMGCHPWLFTFNGFHPVAVHDNRLSDPRLIFAHRDLLPAIYSRRIGIRRTPTRETGSM